MRGVAEPSARRCLFCSGFRLRRLSTKVAESSKIGPTASANDYSNHARLVKQPAVQRVRNPERPGTKHSVLEPCRLEHSNLGRHTGTELKVLPTTGRTRRQNCLAYLSLRRARKTRARILESSVEQNPMVRVLPRFPWDFAKDQIRPYPIDPQEVPADFLTHFLPEPVYTRELRSVGGRQKRDQNPSLPRQPNVRASNAEHFWYGGRCRNCAAIHQQLTDRLNQTAGSADLPTSAPFARLDAGRDAAAVLLDAGRFAFSVSSQSWRVRTSCTSACWALAANRLDSNIETNNGTSLCVIVSNLHSITMRLSCAGCPASSGSGFPVSGSPPSAIRRPPAATDRDISSLIARMKLQKRVRLCLSAAIESPPPTVGRRSHLAGSPEKDFSASSASRRMPGSVSFSEIHLSVSAIRAEASGF